MRGASLGGGYPAALGCCIFGLDQRAISSLSGPDVTAAATSTAREAVPSSAVLSIPHFEFPTPWLSRFSTRCRHDRLAAIFIPPVVKRGEGQVSSSGIFPNLPVTAHQRAPSSLTSPRRLVKRRIAQGRSLLSRDAPHDLRSYVRLIMRKKWTDFVESFGIPYPGIKQRRNYWTREIVLEEIRRWKEEGHPTHFKAVGRDYGPC